MRLQLSHISRPRVSAGHRTSSLCEHPVWHCGSLPFPSMAARHPASQRPPPSQLPDSRDERPQTAPAPRAHLRRTSTASPHSSGADQHGVPTTTPTTTSSVDQRSGHRATSRQHSQNHSRDGDGPRDSVSEEIETPRRRTRSSRQLAGATQTRQGPPDPHAHDKQGQPSEPVDAGTLEPHVCTTLYRRVCSRLDQGY